MNIKKYISFNIIAIVTAISIILATSIHWDEVLNNIFLVIFITIVGYIFGELTCHFHSKGKGFILTLGIFILFNLAHSTIDGISWNNNIIAVFLHELVRQPVLFLLLWGLLIPFTEIKKGWKILTCIFSVSLVWIVGLILGVSIHGFATKIETWHGIIELLVFLLIGDLIHHLVEESKKDGKIETCDHNH
ncbi:MAG: hypothetical protein NTZ44_01365 [Candidatus Nomurabacteria bacterium]|nr:hypothetical protein [Candidatus Nomurabacteria bacterium]